jgi:RimJ/RimL family protein N-acetyltransferase
MKDDAIFIDGKRVYLRPLDMNDLETYYKWFNNPEIRRFLGTPFPITKSDEKDILEKMTKSKDDVYLSIVVKKDKKLIGNMGLHKISRTNRNAMLGITIGDLSEASKGYGTEAMELMIDYGFNVLNLHRIYLGVHEFNERGIKAYKKLGFTEEGRKRDGAYINGEYHDVIMMSILKDEWKKDKNR